MTMTAQRSYTAYRGKVGGTAHNGWKMPEDVNELEPRQREGWEAVANDANAHTAEAERYAREFWKSELDGRNKHVEKLLARVAELERCQALNTSAVKDHSERIATMQGTAE